MKEQNKQYSNWGLAEIWNESLLQKEERPVQPRDRLWASELGKSRVDVWMKLKGIKPTNPPNPRSLRKFEAGNVWEWIVELILLRAGILQSSQKWTKYQYPNLLPVSGKIDFIAGGKPDYEKAEKELTTLLLPDMLLRASKNVIKHFKETYPNGLTPMVLEIKSTSSFMFDIYERKNTSSWNHRLQTFHYLKAEQMSEGMLIYISKDDCRMLEIPISNPSPLEKEYRGEIEAITEHYNDDTRPPLDPELIFDKDIECFCKNWKVGYSSYLTKLYGYKNQKEFDDKYTPISARWNRVLGRIKEGKSVTANNQEALDEMDKMGFDVDKITETILNESKS